MLNKRRQGLAGGPISKMEKGDEILSDSKVKKKKKHHYGRSLSRTPGNFYNAVALENGE